MSRRAQGSAETGAPGTGAGAGGVRVPPQPAVTDVDRDRGRRRDRSKGGAAGAGHGAARGEHTRGETPLLRSRPVVRRASVRGQILDALRTALVMGELTPGEVYSAPALGERFGVSATPVREAMQQLAAQGAVEVVPNRGFRVVERGAGELAELAEIRALIEMPVITRLARTVPVERWAELRPLAEATLRAASSGCRAAYAESDRAFHGAVLALSGNGQLVRIADDLHRRVQRPLGGPPTPRVRAELLADAAQHTALLDALIAGDPDVLATVVSDHFATPPPTRPRHP